MITVKELADELGVTPYTLGQVVNLHSWAEDATVPAELATRAREMLAGQTPEPTAQDAPPAEAVPLTLDNYVPDPLVDAAIDSFLYVTGSKLGSTPKAQVAAMFVVSGIVFSDLVEQGVAPYATAPGEYDEPDRDASAAITQWIAKRTRYVAARHILKRLGLPLDTQVIIQTIEL
jgi:hypothetical protein